MPDSTAVIGRRLADGETTFAEGDYGRVDGVWHVRPPGGHLGPLREHQVTEHPDGTITVSPSILQDDDHSQHWYLHQGAWHKVA